MVHQTNTPPTAPGGYTAQCCVLRCAVIQIFKMQSPPTPTISIPGVAHVYKGMGIFVTEANSLYVRTYFGKNTIL